MNLVVRSGSCWSSYALLLLVATTFSSGKNTATAWHTVTPKSTPKQEHRGDNATQYDTLVKWVKDNGGHVDERLGMGFPNGGSIRGVVALQDIEADTELLFLPWKIVIGTEGSTSKSLAGGHCDVLNLYAQQVRAGEDSFWYPYLALDGSLSSRIPTVWHNSAIDELQGLPPFKKTKQTTLVDWFVETCADGKPFADLDVADRQSLHAAITRGASMRFLPLYDLINHDNGEMNIHFLGDELGVRISAAVHIPAGSEILISYRGGTATVSDVFERYGFVEPYPQQWAWIDEETSTERRFLLLPNDVAIIGPLPEKMTSIIGTAVQPLSDIEAQAESHNMKLSLQMLNQFADSARRLLLSLPTTADEDAAILVDLEQQLSLLSNYDEKNGDAATQLLEDIVSAVTYRKCFKEAIKTAIQVANCTLVLRSEQQEL